MEYPSVIPIALIPAYEPDDILLDILAQLQEEGIEPIVVDDGSGPQYSETFRRAVSMATVLVHDQNCGKGAALKTGMNYIRQTYGQTCVIVTVDADGQHKAEDAARLCRMAEQNPDTLFLGSRRLQGNVPFKSRFGNAITRFVYKLSTGLKMHDTQTGLRAFSGELLPSLLTVSGERYEYEMNVLLEFARSRIPMKEMEIDTIYIDDNAASHFDPLRDSFRIYKEILKFSASSFLGFLTDYILYGLLFSLTANLWVSNIGARIVSAAVNYTCNRRFVFQSEASAAKSAVQYVLLAAAILICNTLFLGWLVRFWGIHQMAAKLLTEILFFFVSWSVQHFIIFRKEGR